MRRKSFAFMLLAAGAGCADSASGPEGTGRVVLQLATSPAGAAASAGTAADDLTITKVQIVARKIRLAQAAETCPQTEGTGDGGVEGEGECPVVKAGPLLLEPPVADGAVAAFTADLPAGRYNRLRFQIHKPTGANDQAFLQANPGFDGVSIKVEGSYNGTPFAFSTALTVVQEIMLEAPVEVVEGTPVEVTLLLDVKSWFAAQGAAGWVNPGTLTQQQRSRIEQNIRAAFRAFKDADRNAAED